MSDVIKLSSPETKEFWEIPVLFEDADLLAVDKPSGLLTSPDRYDPTRPNLMKLLHRGIEKGAPWAKSRGLTYLSNAHRLDFETSGILLLAKNKPTLVALADLFGTAKPAKQYVAIIQGMPGPNKFEVDSKLAPHPFKTGVMHVDARNGKQSLTRFKVEERFRHHALLTCEPVTGRTHQIRIHLCSKRLPICGDGVYGGHDLRLSALKNVYRLKDGKKERPLINRVALHAQRLTLVHPNTKETVEIFSPLPKDMAVALKYLRRYSNLNGPPLTPGDEND